MGMTIAEKIIAAAAGVDSVKPGDIHTVKLDRLMSNDGTTHLTVDMYRNKLKNPHIADTKKLVFIVDHNVPSDSPKTAASQKKMRDFAKENNIDILAMECHIDHVHMFVSVYPQTDIPGIMHLIKGVTSNKLRALFPELKKMPSLWTRSYFVSTAGNVSSETIKWYVDTQKTRY